MDKQYYISYIAEAAEKDTRMAADYKKALAECKQSYLESHPWHGRFTIGERRIFDYAFESAYRYGRQAAMEEAKAQPDKPDGDNIGTCTISDNIVAPTQEACNNQISNNE